MKQIIHNTILAALLLTSGSRPLTTLADDKDLRTEAEKAITAVQNADSTTTKLFKNSAGYVVFPSIGKAGLILGSEYGKGVLYEKGKPVGEATVTEINLGLQAGGESFYEVIFFETADALADFKQGNLEMSAKVSFIAAKEGAALDAKYRDGVLVVALPRTGLMAQAAVGGQKFKYKSY